MKVINQLREIREYLDSKDENEFLQEEVYDIVLTHINSKIEPSPSVAYMKGKGDLRPLIKKLGPKVIMESIDISAKQYLEYENNVPTQNSIEIFYRTIGGIAVNRYRGTNPWSGEDK